MNRFRNFRTLIMVLGLLMFSVSSPRYAASDEPFRVFVNGFQVLFTQLPVLEEGSMLVQLRPIYEKLDIKIDWDETTQTITGSKNAFQISMTVNSTEASVDGKAVIIPIAPRIMYQSTFVPLRFVAESVGGDVTWDEKTNHINIITDKGYYVFLAAARNDLKQVKYWLNNGGGPDFKNKNDGLTTLSFAIQRNNVEMLEMLLKSSADPNLSLVGFGDFIRPLISAVFEKDPRIVQLLIEYGADVNHTTREGTALDTAKNLLKKQTNSSDKQNLEEIMKILENKMKSK
ncbi:stalk domain-containing protein [Paenibacillus oryzisoli]|uniref:Copper amine oxidase-like N-terminal domain-containing protein n=1 Tax=Paenibacillus oryzisoli TaxID=1850517 RepID=A0A197ZX04_9BACL|nr:stalk domain-containing protein [Paenibacillus oryzisoli]OAS13258.1 hypothetical protein A8708_10680 [Paenibacillus oryzisoli]